MSRGGLLTASVLILSTAFGVAVPTAGDRNAEARALLDELNRRWVGADARMRVSIELKGSTDREGWSESRWMMHQAVSDKAEGFYLRVRVSNRRALGPLMADDTLLSGARFRALGWGFEEPDRAKGLYLDLEFSDAPARMRWVFTRRGSTSSRIEADELVHIERYLRIDAFEVRPPAERLVAAAPVATPTPRPPLPTPTPVVLVPELAVMTTEVRPAQVRPGGEVRLIVEYQVTGLRPGETREVTEIRRLAVGDRSLEAFEHRIRRPTGSVTSELPVQVPFDAVPGVYAVGTTLRMSGQAASDTAFFVVTTSGVAP